MERMHRPAVPVTPVPVLSMDELKALLAACAGKAFEDKRDSAIVRLFVDTGMRRAELLGLRVSDLDLRQRRRPRDGQGPAGTGVPVRVEDGVGLGPLSAAPWRT